MSTSLVTKAAKAAPAVITAAFTAPEIAGLIVVGTACVCVGVSVVMIVSWLTGTGASLRVNKDGLGLNVGPGPATPA